MRSVAPPHDVLIVFVDGVSAVQLTEAYEFTDVVFAVGAGRHVIDFSYQYNIFGTNPLPPSPDTRLGKRFFVIYSLLKSSVSYHLLHQVPFGLIPL